MPNFNKHDAAYHPKDAWRQYSIAELGTWVDVLTRRATVRTDKEKKEKDLYDAQNYLDMMQERLNEIASQ